MDRITGAIEAVKNQLPAIECRLNELMKKHTSIKVGAATRAMFLPKSSQELLDLCKLLQSFEIAPLIIGNGTNLLVDDSIPLEMIVVKTTGIDGVRLTGECEITAEAGILLSKLAEYAHSYGLSGLEFAHGIPGTLGGGVLMNAGAYGGEMKDIIYSTTALRSVAALDSSKMTAEVYTLIGDEHGFAYRNSVFSGINDIILSSVIRLEKSDKDSIREKMDELKARRRESQPLDLPSAGSTFKRPKEGYAAARIEQAGLKGFAIGGAQVSGKHSGFIVNNGDATFADIMALIAHVKETVYKQFNVELETEYKIIRA